MTKKGLVTEAVDTKVTTRQTYVLTGIDGDLVQKDGKLTFLEKVRPDHTAQHLDRPAAEACLPHSPDPRMFFPPDTCPHHAPSRTPWPLPFLVRPFGFGPPLAPLGMAAGVLHAMPALRVFRPPSHTLTQARSHTLDTHLTTPIPFSGRH